MNFEWDEKKNLANQEKHGVSFEEAKTVFYDEQALLEYDELHSVGEDRFRILGQSCMRKILLVVHCIREESIIRIVSSRKATATEKRDMKGDYSMENRDKFLDKEFDFNKAIKNPYAKDLKKTITINLDESVVGYFKSESKSVGVPYQTLINMYLRDCMVNDRHLDIAWK